MDDEMEAFEVPMGDISSAQPALDLIENTLDSFMAAASVDAVYGEPVVHGDTLIIPVAEVVGALGFGVGSGGGAMPVEDEGEGGTVRTADSGGGGGGGGGSVFSRPVAVVIVTPAGVRVAPVVDVTKIVLASVTAAAFALGMLLQVRKFQRTVKKFS